MRKFKRVSARSLIISLDEGDSPRSLFWGFAYEDMEDFKTVWALMPINYLIKWQRYISYKWYRLRNKRGKMDKLMFSRINRAVSKERESLESEIKFWRNKAENMK
jgi:hypothetical protein